MGSEIALSLNGVVGGLSIALIAMALWRLPPGPVVRPLYAFVAAGVIWGVGDLIATAATDMTAKRVGLAMLYSGSIPIAALWWVVALRWAEGVGARLPLGHPLWSVAPLAFAFVMWLAMLTNPLHGAFITPVVGGRNVYGPIWFAMAGVNYALIVAALGVEIWAAVRSTGDAVRRQAAFLVAASLVSLLGNVVYVLDWLPYNATMVMLSISATLLVIGMASEGLFGVLPAALPEIAADHPDGLVVFGPDGRVRYANERARALLAPSALVANDPVAESLRGSGLRVDGRAGGRVAGDADFWRTLAHGDARPLRLEAEGGRLIDAHAHAVVGRVGWSKGYCLRLADVTDRVEAERRERRARRLDSVASLTRRVARDFQSDFAVILANAEIGADGAEDAASARRRARIVEAARSGLDLAHQLQLFAGTTDAVHRSFDLVAAADDIVAMIGSDLPDGVALAHVAGAAALPIEGDPVQIRQALYELITNAVEASAAGGGDVRVESGVTRVDPADRTDLVHGDEEPVGHFAFVRVVDAGGGMDADTAERAFEPFFGTRGKGRGHGLSTVLGIARAHEALLAFDNRPADGCTLTLYCALDPETPVDTLVPRG